MITVLVVAQLTIISASPPLPPADAARTLQHASPDRDLSGGLWSPDRDAPSFVLTAPSSMRKEPGRIVPRVSLPDEYVPPAPLTREIPGLSWEREPCGGPRGPVCASIVIEDRRRHRSR